MRRREFITFIGGTAALSALARAAAALDYPTRPVHDPRYKWFVANYGKRCWELDAMDPNALRACVEREIKKLIDPVAWKRCEIINKAEQESLRSVLDSWRGVGADERPDDAA